MKPITPDAVMEIVAAESGIDRARLNPDATLGDLDISSLDLASIAFTLEDEFGIELAPEELKPDLTLGAFVEHVRALRTA